MQTASSAIRRPQRAHVRVSAPARQRTLLFLSAACAVLAGCADGPSLANRARYTVGGPYRANGIQYLPQEDFSYDAVGLASWYGDAEHGRKTANGEIFDRNGLTAAHPTLQLPCLVEVTNLENGRMLRLRVNDRGPFVAGRILDVSQRAAQLLGFEQLGTATVRVRILPAESLDLAIAAGRPRSPYETRLATGGPAPLYVEAALPAASDAAAWRSWSMSVVGAPAAILPDLGVYRLRLGPFGGVDAAERALVQLLNAGLSNATIVAPPVATLRQTASDP